MAVRYSWKALTSGTGASGTRNRSLATPKPSPIAPHGLVAPLDADVVLEELLPMRGGTVQQQLEPGGKVADDGIERDEKILDPALRQAVLRRIFDDRCAQDRLLDRLQSRVQFSDPGGVRADLHGA